MLAVQPAVEGEEEFTDAHMLLRVRLWRPAAQDLTPVEEVAVLREGTVADLKHVLQRHHARLRRQGKLRQRMTKEEGDKKEIEQEAREEAGAGGETGFVGDDGCHRQDQEASGDHVTDKPGDRDRDDHDEDGVVSAEDIVVVKPFAYLLKDLANMPSLRWTPQPSPEALISQPSLRLRDGDLIVYKDSRVPEQAGSPVGEPSTSAVTWRPPAEQGFVIYTLEQVCFRDHALTLGLWKFQFMSACWA